MKFFYLLTATFGDGCRTRNRTPHATSMHTLAERLIRCAPNHLFQLGQVGRQSTSDRDRSADVQPQISTSRALSILPSGAAKRYAAPDPEPQGSKHPPIRPKGPSSTARPLDTPSRILLSTSREGCLTGERIALSRKRVSRSTPETPQEPNFGSRTKFDLPQGVPGTARGRQIVGRGRQLVPRGRQFFLQRAPRSPPRAPGSPPCPRAVLSPPAPQVFEGWCGFGGMGARFPPADLSGEGSEAAPAPKAGRGIVSCSEFRCRLCGAQTY